jgi:hypothetical protein
LMRKEYLLRRERLEICLEFVVGAVHGRLRLLQLRALKLKTWLRSKERGQEIVARLSGMNCRWITWPKRVVLPALSRPRNKIFADFFHRPE